MTRSIFQTINNCTFEDTHTAGGWCCCQTWTGRTFLCSFTHITQGLPSNNIGDAPVANPLENMLATVGTVGLALLDAVPAVAPKRTPSPLAAWVANFLRAMADLMYSVVLVSSINNNNVLLLLLIKCCCCCYFYFYFYYHHKGLEDDEDDWPHHRWRRWPALSEKKERMKDQCDDQDDDQEEGKEGEARFVVARSKETKNSPPVPLWLQLQSHYYHQEQYQYIPV